MIATWIPVGGVAIFVALYVYAASLYPGGTAFEPGSIGYTHLANYWCDLLRVSAYSGAVNPGRGFAVLATVVLPLSLVPFWLVVPVLFRENSKSRRTVQVTGTVAMLASIFIFTSKHNLAINIAAPLAFAAFAITAFQPFSRRNLGLVVVSVLSATLGLANYLMWEFRVLLWAMPAIQKAAFAGYFLWVILCCNAIRHQLVSRVEIP